jgi:hypothetical protein
MMLASRIGMWVQYLGMTVAVAGGAPWPHPRWVFVHIGLAIVLGGIAWKRLADRSDPRLGGGEGAARMEGSVPAATAALDSMLEKVRDLASRMATLPLVEIAQTIDTLQRDGTEAVAAAQDAFVRTFGFQKYASVMSPLASAERWLYRAWSSASDGHRAETVESVNSAVPYVEEAQRALAALKA